MPFLSPMLEDSQGFGEVLARSVEIAAREMKGATVDQGSGLPAPVADVAIDGQHLP